MFNSYQKIPNQFLKNDFVKDEIIPHVTDQAKRG